MAGCNGGCGGGGSTLITLTPVFDFYGDDADYQLVIYAGDAGEVVGAVSGQSYGFRNTGDSVFVHTDDIAAMNVWE